jgi:hypothetical protein
MEAVMKSRHKLILVAAASALLGATAAEVIHAQANTPPAFLIAEIKVNSPAYQEIAPIRLKTATSRIYFIEGVAP